MVDCISSLPDSILCDILSSLPTKEVVATSVLSKRWILLWRSVPSFHFDYDGDHFDYDKDKEACFHFLQSVDSFLLRRDRDEPLHRFRLKSNSLFDHTVSINKWIRAAVSGSGRVQHLALCCDWNVVMPSVVFTCRTLVVLKLTLVTLEDVSFVDLPLLEILHLNSVRLSEGLNLSQFLSGCPNLKDLKVYETYVQNIEKFIRLPKLARASVHEKLLPLEVLKDVEVLFLVLDIYQRNLVFDFQNLVQLELILQHKKDWLRVLEVLQHCPKLQTLVICLVGREGVVPPYPQPDPVCISFHLKTCCLKEYHGSIDEFQFARYILEKANYLQTMKICTDSDADYTLGKKLYMRRQLSSCRKGSDTCTLSFE
ncbi:F-box/FBD/LRR-repeat protein At5g56420-like [Vigna unguiculata]|uniref:F-box/FBD/LRR-repeat protein At5g56420-like n=1 Tax=Vigna unguiculata TaxID=3917 RepID=UPI0010171CFC|nr:F-box/FBD/LRR-repeat protein At5g56420-like [Vigna unguiculata]